MVLYVYDDNFRSVFHMNLVMITFKRLNTLPSLQYTITFYLADNFANSLYSFSFLLL